MTSDQPPTVPPGWYPDPHGIAELRWWDGSDWTDNIHNSLAPAEEYHPPGQIEDESGSPIFDLDYVPDAAIDEPSPMHELFSVELQPTVEAQPTVEPQSTVDANSAELVQSTSPQFVAEVPVLAEAQEAPVAQEMPAAPAVFTPHSVAPPPVSAVPPMNDSSVPEFLAAVPAADLPVAAEAEELANVAPAATVAAEESMAARTDPLPSRRELRQREQSAAAPVQMPGAAPTATSEDATTHAPSDTPVSANPVPANPVSADPATTGPAPIGPVNPSAPFDTSVATSFNWAVEAPVTPSLPVQSDALPMQSDAPPVPPASAEAAPEPAVAQSVTQEPVAVPPVSAGPVSAEPVAAEPVAAEPVSAEPVAAGPVAAPPQQAPDLAAFPPPAPPVLSAEQPTLGSFGLQGVSGQTTPVESADPAWSRGDAAFGVTNQESPLPWLQSSTASSWLMAFLPLMAGILGVGAVKGAENYPRYAPAGMNWWMLVAGVLVVLYLATLLFAMADRKKLDSWGYGFPAPWAWAFATAPVYLVARTIAIKRETGRMTPQLWVWIALTLVVGGAYFAALFLAPELVSGYTLPGF